MGSQAVVEFDMNWYSTDDLETFFQYAIRSLAHWLSASPILTLLQHVGNTCLANPVARSRRLKAITDPTFTLVSKQTSMFNT
jgi:hypothetical protein